MEDKVGVIGVLFQFRYHRPDQRDIETTEEVQDQVVGVRAGRGHPFQGERNSYRLELANDHGQPAFVALAAQQDAWLPTTIGCHSQHFHFLELSPLLGVAEDQSGAQE